MAESQPLRSPMPDWRRHFIGATTEHEVVTLTRAHCSLRYAGDQDFLVMRLLAFMSEAAIRMAEVKAVEAAAARVV